MMQVRINATGSVECRAELVLPMSTSRAWGQLRDFARYAAQDHFHAEIRIEGAVPRQGAALAIEHRMVFWRVQRVGRILLWREGTGFSFSDLSQRGPRHGFPHVFSYSLAPVDADHCRLSIRIAGRWTAKYTPHWAAKLWLWWVFLRIVTGVENQLLMFRLALKPRLKYSAAGGQLA